MENLLTPKDVTGWKSWLKETMKQAGTEASEEALTEIANILSDAAIMGESSQFSQAVQEHRRGGMTDTQAKQQAFLDCVGQVAWASAGGLISGSVTGGVVNGVRGVTNTGAQTVAGLGEYTEQEANNLLAFAKNHVLGFGTSIKDFVSKSRVSRTNGERLYMGKLPETTVSMVKESTGLNVEGFSSLINSDSVRHAFHDHGDAAREAARGQIAITEDDFLLLPEILSAPDSVTLSPDLDAYGRPALIFTKKIGDKYVTVQGYSKRKQSIAFDTMWINKEQASPVTAHAGNSASPLQTSETHAGTTPVNSIIPNSGRIVNDGQAISNVELLSNVLAENGMPRAARYRNTAGMA